MKVLIIDTDPQGSIVPLLGLKPTAHLFNFLIQNYRFEECLTPAHPNIDVICSGRDTTDAEHHILTQVYREFVFEKVFSPHEDQYGAIIVDVPPSISLLQTCAMIFCRRVLIPVAMETLSLQGCSASINAASVLIPGRDGGRENGRNSAVMVNPRLQMTDMVMRAIKQISEVHHVPILPSIRQDVEVVKAAKMRKFLVDHAPASRALQDYTEAAKVLLEYLDSGKEHERQAS